MYNILKEMLRSQLNPNEFFILYGLENGIDLSSIIDYKLHLTSMFEKGLIFFTQDKWILTSKGKTLLKEISDQFATSYNKKSTTLLKEDYTGRIEEYVELFPKIKLPSGKYARDNVKNLIDAFKWFFSKYEEFDWDTIIQATKLYVNECQFNNYQFMRTSKYFIRKQESDKTWTSDLSTYCEVVKNGLTSENNLVNVPRENVL